MLAGALWCRVNCRLAPSVHIEDVSSPLIPGFVSPGLDPYLREAFLSVHIRSAMFNQLVPVAGFGFRGFATGMGVVEMAVADFVRAVSAHICFVGHVGIYSEGLTGVRFG